MMKITHANNTKKNAYDKTEESIYGVTTYIAINKTKHKSDTSTKPNGIRQSKITRKQIHIGKNKKNAHHLTSISNKSTH